MYHTDELQCENYCRTECDISTGKFCCEHRIVLVVSFVVRINHIGHKPFAVRNFLIEQWKSFKSIKIPNEKILDKCWFLDLDGVTKLDSWNITWVRFFKWRTDSIDGVGWTDKIEGSSSSDKSITTGSSTCRLMEVYNNELHQIKLLIKLR